MVKIRNKRKLEWALKQYEKSGKLQIHLSMNLGISARRFRQLYKEYKETGKLPVIGKNLGRPRKELPEEYYNKATQLFNW